MRLRICLQPALAGQSSRPCLAGSEHPVERVRSERFASRPALFERSVVGGKVRHVLVAEPCGIAVHDRIGPRAGLEFLQCLELLGLRLARQRGEWRHALALVAMATGAYGGLRLAGSGVARRLSGASRCEPSGNENSNKLHEHDSRPLWLGGPDL